MTARAPERAATEIAVVIPRSLKEPVGLSPSYLMWTSAPTTSERWAAGISGVPPSPSVTTGAPARDGSRSRYSSITPRHGEATSLPLDAHDGGDTADRRQRRDGVDRGRQRRVGGGVGDHDQAGAPVTVTVGVCPEQLLAHRLDGHLVLGEGRGDLREHTGTVQDVEADVVAGGSLAHVQDRQVGVGRLPGPAPAHDLVPGHGDDVTEDGGGSRVAT